MYPHRDLSSVSRSKRAPEWHDADPEVGTLQKDYMGPKLNEIKANIKRILPASLLQAYRNIHSDLVCPRNASDVFAEIYEQGKWREAPDSHKKYYSGWGSHDERIVDEYTKSVKKFVL